MTERPEDRSVWTISDLQRQALVSSPALQVARQTIESAAGRQQTARAYPNPQLEYLSGTERPRSGVGASGRSQQVQLTQPIEWLDAREARIQTASRQLDAARNSTLVVANDVLSDVRLRALEWLIRQEDIRLLQDSVQLLEQTRQRVSVRVESGEAPRYELIKADAEVLGARSRMDAAKAQAEATRLRLSQLVGLPLPLDFSLTGPRSMTPDLDRAAALLRKLESTNPELKVRTAELQAAESRLREQMALRKPALSLRAASDQTVDNTNNQIGVAITVPLFDQRKGQVREAQAEQERARLQLQGRTYELTQQALAAYAALLAAQRRVEALEGGVLKQAQAALDVAEAAYKFGERGILDTLDAQRVLRSVRNDLTQARLESLAAAAELERLSGSYLALVPEYKISEE